MGSTFTMKTATTAQSIREPTPDAPTPDANTDTNNNTSNTNTNNNTQHATPTTTPNITKTWAGFLPTRSALLVTT